MTDATRYKTIATIAVAFSLGNLFSTACGTGPIAAANTAKLEADVAKLKREVNSLNCVIEHMTDNRRLDLDVSVSQLTDFSGGNADWTQGYASDAGVAYTDCF